MERLREVCERYGVASLEVFGSVARGEDSGQSDIDVLYVLKPGVRLGFRLFDLEDELADVFDRPVDLVARRSVNKYLREQVLADGAAPLCGVISCSFARCATLPCQSESSRAGRPYGPVPRAEQMATFAVAKDVRGTTHDEARAPKSVRGLRRCDERAGVSGPCARGRCP